MLLALRKGLRELCTTYQMLYFNVANSSESLENNVMHYIWYITMLLALRKGIKTYVMH